MITNIGLKFSYSESAELGRLLSYLQDHNLTYELDDKYNYIEIYHTLTEAQVIDITNIVNNNPVQERKRLDGLFNTILFDIKENTPANYLVCSKLCSEIIYELHILAISNNGAIKVRHESGHGLIKAGDIEWLSESSINELQLVTRLELDKHSNLICD